MATQTLDEIVAGAQAFVRSSVESSKKLQENTAVIVQKTGEIAKTYETVATDVAVVTATQQAAQLKVQQQNSQIARAAGIDPEAGANIIVETVSKLRRSNAETEQALIEYRKKNEQSFIDNPIDWVVAQITLPIAEAKLQGAASQSKLYGEQLNVVNTTLQNSFQTTEKLKESVSAASAESATRVAAAQALINAQQTSIEGLKYNAIGIKEAQDANKDQLNAMYTSFQATQSAAQLALSQANSRRESERFEWQKQEKKLMDEARGDAKAVDDMLAAKINTGRAALGLPQVSGTEMKSAVTLLKSGASKDMAMYYEVGERTIANGGKSGIATSPAEAAKTLNAVPNALPDIQKETAQLLQDAVQALAASKTIDKKDTGAVNGFINQHVDAALQEDYRRIVPNAQNLFDVGDLNSYLGLSTIKDLPVVTKLLAPLAAAKQPLNDPKLILGFMQDAMKKGTLTTDEINGIATVYQKANLINQAARGFSSFGMQLPAVGKKAPGMNYMASIERSQVIDMTDPAAIQRYLAKEMSKTMGNRIAEDRADSPFLRN